LFHLEIVEQFDLHLNQSVNVLVLILLTIRFDTFKLFGNTNRWANCRDE